ncbi:fucolectin-like [Crassostrea virginica]
MTDVVEEWSCVKSQNTESNVEPVARQKWKRVEHCLTTLTDVDIWQWYVAVKKPATMSSVRKPGYHHASNAVDNVTVCPTGLSTAHTDHEFSPWIKIDLLDIYDLNSVVIYNRQDDFGHRLHDLQINTGINGRENTCGFYEGPAVTGERIVVHCTSGARGSYVLLTILTPLGETDCLTVCEIQIFVNN